MLRHLVMRHPFAVDAYFDFVLALTFAVPVSQLEPLLYPGLELDTYGGDAGEEEWGFLAIAMVQTRNLRPAFLPASLGQDFFLTGYRLFVRYRTPEGRSLRGLQVLRSDTDKPLLRVLGNLMTHYLYHAADVNLSRNGRRAEISVASHDGQSDLQIRADLETEGLPEGSVFPDSRTARRFAGPMPYTFSYEPETDSIIRVEGVRQSWRPRLVQARVEEVGFLAHLGLEEDAELAAAFTLEGVPYRWRKGVVSPAFTEPSESPPRRPLQGVSNIVRFNWPAYTAAAATATVGAVVASSRKVQTPVRLLAGAAAAGAVWQAAASLTASHRIYDRSELYDLSWLRSLWPAEPRSILNAHAGFDETSSRLRSMFPEARLQVLDFYDPERNPEPSIARARAAFPPERGAIRVGASQWPVPDRSADAVLVFLAAHEMRKPDDRQELFAELRRVTAAEGRIVIVEHLRDAANFGAFGPGFLHFLPRRVWTEETRPHLDPIGERPLTPFLRVFCYRPSSATSEPRP